MYHAVEVADTDKDLHRFVWRKDLKESLLDYCMMRLMFGVSASPFAANMSLKQHAANLAHQFPLAAAAVNQSFYVDDGLTGADTIGGVIKLQTQLQCLFSEGGFLLMKWNSSDSAVLQHIPLELRDQKSIHPMPSPEEYTKTLGVEWNAGMDHFRLTISQPPSLENITKRALISDVAKMYDVLGWFAPVVIKVKILFQLLWELKVDWDEPVPLAVKQVWLRWRDELPCLSKHHIPRCYFPQEVQIVSTELHGFSDASEQAYAGVVYLRMVDTNAKVHVSLVMSKTKVAPVKRLTIPRLELCGAQLLARLLHHAGRVFGISTCNLYAWTDSTIVLGWLTGNPRRFKTYVGNRISNIMELVAPERWNHVSGLENPADCASRGLFPSELLENELWWDGPRWLRLEPSEWPKQSSYHQSEPCGEEKTLSFLSTVIPRMSVMPINRFSSFGKMTRITAWILRFLYNCRGHRGDHSRHSSPNLSVQELLTAEEYWIKFAQADHFPQEIEALRCDKNLPNSTCLLPLHPFLDSSGVLRVGGRERYSNRPFTSQHPAILQGTHPIAKLIIQAEHLRLLHAGPTLLGSSLSRRFHFVGGRKIIRSITRGCAVCRRDAARPQPQMLGQLPVQ